MVRKDGRSSPNERQYSPHSLMLLPTSISGAQRRYGHPHAYPMSTTPMTCPQRLGHPSSSFMLTNRAPSHAGDGQPKGQVTVAEAMGLNIGEMIIYSLTQTPKWLQISNSQNEQSDQGPGTMRVCLSCHES